MFNNSRKSSAGHHSSRSDFSRKPTTARDWTGNSAGARRAKLAAREISSTLFDQTGELKLGRKHRPDYLMVILVIALALTGLVVVFSILPALTLGSDSSAAAYMWKQGGLLAIAIVGFFVAGQIPLDFWRKWGSRIFVLALFLCLILPLMGMVHLGLANCSLGACRWFNLGFASFQPAELLKLGLVLFISSFLAIRAAAGEINSARKTLLPLGVAVLAVLFIIVILQKDLGTGLALTAIVLTQMIVAGIKWRNFAIALGALGGLGVASIIVAPHRIARIATFFGTGTAAQDYHINQALIALGSGGLGGRGLGQSVQAYGWLPEAVSDSIFAVFGEMFGFIGVMILIAAFAALLKRILDKIDYTENLYLRLIVAGVFGWVAAHVLLNIGAMTHIIPLTGITLPLVSLGGTSMLFIMIALGIVFAISRYTQHRKLGHEEILSSRPPRFSRNISRNERGR